MRRRSFQTTTQQFVKFFCFVYKSAAKTAQRKRRSDNQRVADFLRRFFAFQIRIGNIRRRNLHPNFYHQLTKKITIFGTLDSFDINANHTTIVLFPNTEFIGFDCQVQGRLTTHCRQNSINLTFFQYKFDAFNCQRHQINMVGSNRVGHNRSRIRVDERYLNPFFAQRA